MSSTSPGSKGSTGSGPEPQVVVVRLLAMLVIGVIVIGIILGVAKNLEQPARAIAAGVALLVGIAIGWRVWDTFAGKVTPASGGKGHGGGHGDDKWAVATALSVLACVAGITILFAEFTHVKVLNEQGYQERRAAKMGIQEIVFSAREGAVTEIPVKGGETSVVIPEGPILMGYNSEPPFEYGGEPRVFPKRRGSYLLKIWGKGPRPVNVKVLVTPSVQ